MSALTAQAAALQLAEDGLPVFPCQQDKRPYTAHGLNDASTDSREIMRWWRRWPGALVGVPTGRRSGLLAIDIDPAGAEWHRDNDHRLACGRVHKTPRGHHLLYRYPPDSEIRNSAGRIAPGVDVRGEGGYIIWWPAHGLEVVGGMEDLSPPPITDGGRSLASRDGAPQGAGELITEGQRNDSLSREAYRLRKQGCNADQIADVLRALNKARCSPPLPGPEVVAIAKGKARIPPGENWTEPPPIECYAEDAAPGAFPGGEAVYRCVSEIESKPIRWLWPGRIAKGKVFMLAGHPGLGKSQAMISMAAIVTTGGSWPVDRTPCEQGSVLILSAEDDVEDTIRPRLEAAGADLKRVFILDAIRETNPDGASTKRPFNLTEDIDRLRDLASELGDVMLIVIDPITAYLGHVDSHRNAEVRAVLAPLAEMAAGVGAAVVCVSHLTKAAGTEAMLRVMGSLGFVAAARGAYLVAKDPEDDTRRLFLPMKNNLAEDRGGLAFRVRGRDLGNGIVTSCVEWDSDPVTMTADEALVPAGDPEERSELEDAKGFLRGLLKDGPVASKQIRADAKGACYAWRTIRRAQDALGIKAIKEGMKGPWVWEIPPKVAKNTEEAQQKNVDAFGNVGHLRGTSNGDSGPEGAEAVQGVQGVQGVPLGREGHLGEPPDGEDGADDADIEVF
ncbi:MAG: AAA family ATPase [Gammaproteobacteria bacterium]